MPIRIDTGVPAGNAIVHAFDGRSLTFAPDLRDTTQPWFYWQFRARGCAGHSLHVTCLAANCLTERGAALSVDGGRSWAWIEDYDPASAAFTLTAGEHDHLRLCLAMPYTRRDLDRWLAANAQHPDLRVHGLCRTAQHRALPWLELGRHDGGECAQVVLSARHHCCEMMASWVLEGLMDAVLADAATGRALRAGLRLLVVPLVDGDGVEAGDQGKSRHPHDHNRDYYEQARYPETRALMELVTATCDTRFRLALDLHCPWIRGGNNHHIYIVGSRDPGNAERQAAFARVLEAGRVGPLPYRAAETLAFGKDWNTTPALAPGMTCAGWMLTRAPERVTSATIEIPYAVAGGVTVDPRTARAFGADLAAAMAEFLL